MSIGRFHASKRAKQQQWQSMKSFRLENTIYRVHYVHETQKRMVIMTRRRVTSQRQRKERQGRIQVRNVCLNKHTICTRRNVFERAKCLQPSIRVCLLRRYHRPCGTPAHCPWHQWTTPCMGLKRGQHTHTQTHVDLDLFSLVCVHIRNRRMRRRRCKNGATLTTRHFRPLRSETINI